METICVNEQLWKTTDDLIFFCLCCFTWKKKLYNIFRLIKRRDTAASFLSDNISKIRIKNDNTIQNIIWLACWEVHIIALYHNLISQPNRFW